MSEEVSTKERIFSTEKEAREFINSERVVLLEASEHLTSEDEVQKIAEALGVSAEEADSEWERRHGKLNSAREEYESYWKPRLETQASLASMDEIAEPNMSRAERRERRELSEDAAKMEMSEIEAAERGGYEPGDLGGMIVTSDSFKEWVKENDFNKALNWSTDLQHDEIIAEQFFSQDYDGTESALTRWGGTEGNNGNQAGAKGDLTVPEIRTGRVVPDIRHKVPTFGAMVPSRTTRERGTVRFKEEVHWPDNAAFRKELGPMPTERYSEVEKNASIRMISTSMRATYEEMRDEPTLRRKINSKIGKSMRRNHSLVLLRGNEGTPILGTQTFADQAAVDKWYTQIGITTSENGGDGSISARGNGSPEREDTPTYNSDAAVLKGLIDAVIGQTQPTDQANAEFDGLMTVVENWGSGGLKERLTSGTDLIVRFRKAYLEILQETNSNHTPNRIVCAPLAWEKIANDLDANSQFRLGSASSTPMNLGVAGLPISFSTEFDLDSGNDTFIMGDFSNDTLEYHRADPMRVDMTQTARSNDFTKLIWTWRAFMSGTLTVYVPQAFRIFEIAS